VDTNLIGLEIVGLSLLLVVGLFHFGLGRVLGREILS